jgi:hypothetical protein
VLIDPSGLEDFDLVGITIIALAGLGVALLTIWIANHFERWWNRHVDLG